MTLSAIGQLASLEDVAVRFRQAIEASDLAEPAAFLGWAEQILVDHPERQALVLPAGTAIAGDLNLDALSNDVSAAATVVVFGDLAITGRLINEDTEGGPFLLIAGNLSVGHISKAASSIVVLGSITAQGLIFCDTDNGILAAGRGIEARAVIDNDHEIYAGEGITGTVVSDDAGNMRAALVPEVFEDPDDVADEWPDGDLIRARLAAGLPVLKV